MTESEERKYINLIARHEGTMHRHVCIQRVVQFEDNTRNVFAMIKMFQYGYFLVGDVITKSWRVV